MLIIKVKSHAVYAAIKIAAIFSRSTRPGRRLTVSLRRVFYSLALVLPLTCNIGSAADDVLEAVTETTPAPPLILNDLNGQSYDLSDASGRVVLVNFWAVWCTPCRAEMPSMQLLNQQFAGEDFEIVAVDMGSSRKHIDAFLEEISPRLEFTIVLDEVGEVASTWGVRGIPVSFIIDRQGNVAYKATGERNWAAPAIASVLQSLLSQH